MSAVSSVLSKLLVARFFRINTGFFLFFFLLLFGIADPGATLHAHLALMKTMARSPVFLMTGMAVWTLYYAKCILYCLRTIREPEQGFLLLLQGLPLGKLQRLLAVNLALIFLPVLLYAGATMVIAATLKQPVAVCAMLVYHALIFLVGTRLCYTSISETWREGILDKYLEKLAWRRSRPARFSRYLLLYSLQHRKGTIAVIKVCSLLLLQVMVAINGEKLQPEGTYFFLLIVITAHAMLPYYYVTFTEHQSWLRNLPLTISRRMLYYAATYAVLFLPELIFLLVHVHSLLSPLQMLSLYAMMVAVLCWYTGALYVPRMNVERYTLLAGCTLFGTLFLLAMCNIWLLVAGWVCLFVILFLLFFRHYETDFEATA